MAYDELSDGYKLIQRLEDFQRRLDSFRSFPETRSKLTRHELLAAQQELGNLRHQLHGLTQEHRVLQNTVQAKNTELSHHRKRSTGTATVIPFHVGDESDWEEDDFEKDFDKNGQFTRISVKAVRTPSVGDAGIEEWKPRKQEWIIMISLSVISLAVALDATILVSVLPIVATALNGSSSDAFWAGTSYLLSSAVFQPVIASLSELFGRQQLLLLALFFFTLGSIICAAAPNFSTLFAGRSIQGIGGGGIITSSQIIFCDLVPLRQRPKYFAMVLGSWSLGSIIGPVVGGAIGENTTWRWVFYINFPFCLIGIILALLFVKLKSSSTETLLQKLKQVDWFGAVLFLGGSTTALVGLSWGGVQHPWDSAQTLVPIIVGFVFLGAFIFWQMYLVTYTLLPMSIFRGSSALAAFYSALINGLLLYVALYYWPFYFMAVRSRSPVKAGVDLFPALFSLLPGSILVSTLTSRLGRFRWAIWSGWVISTTGCGLAIFAADHDNKAVWAVTLSVFGIGSGMVLTSVNVAIQAISRVEDSAMAASMYGFMRSLGMPIGVVVSGTVFQNAMSSKLKELGLPAEIAHDSERYIFVLRAMALDDPKRLAILEAYKHGFRNVWIMATVVSATAMVVSLVIKKFDMDKMLASKFSARNEV